MASHSENGAIQVNIFSASEIRVKPGSNLKQGANSTSQISDTGRWFSDPTQYFQQRRLPGAVFPQKPDCFPRSDLE